MKTLQCIETWQGLNTLFKRLKGPINLRGMSLDTKLNMATLALAPHGGKAEDLNTRKTTLDRLHHRCCQGFRQFVHDERTLFMLHPIMQRSPALIKHPINHRPCHHGKSRHKEMITDRKAWNLVVGVRNNRCADRKVTHFQTLLVFRQTHVGATPAFRGHVSTSLGDQAFCLRVQDQFTAEGRCCGLAGVIIRGCPNPAATDHPIATLKAVAKAMT